MSRGTVRGFIPFRPSNVVWLGLDGIVYNTHSTHTQQHSTKQNRAHSSIPFRASELFRSSSVFFCSRTEALCCTLNCNGNKRFSPPPLSLSLLLQNTDSLSRSHTSFALVQGFPPPPPPLNDEEDFHVYLFMVQCCHCLPPLPNLP